MNEAFVTQLDRLIRLGTITGYTIEPPPLYLGSRVPTLTYSMYARDTASRRNIDTLLDDLRSMAAALSLRLVQGNVRDQDGGIERTEQVRLAASFSSRGAFNLALGRIRHHYVAGGVESSHPASWLLPDVRLTGVAGRPAGAISAVAHTLPVGASSVVVLSLSARPPLSGMRSYPVFLLERWGSYLAGKQVAGGWTDALGEYQAVTEPLLTAGR